MKKIVVIGGGTGSYTVLKALKDFNPTAIVSMFDSGGSTGILRDEFGILPPGDVRRCLLALAQEDGDQTLRKLFTYRFKKDSSLKGHSFGNLFLTALTEITGSEPNSIKKAAEILKIKGKVLPVSISNSHLCATLENDELIKGETNIDIPKHNPKLKIKNIFLEPKAKIFSEVKKVIKEADLIILGPGDIYTSIIPNLLVEGVSKSINKSKAKKIYICNLMTKFGETNNYSASDHLNEIMKYLKGNIDYIICNNKSYSKILLQKYAKENAFPVKIDIKEIKRLNVKLIATNLIKEPNLIRHDYNKLFKLLTEHESFNF